jgi:hypothetical protein
MLSLQCTIISLKSYLDFEAKAHLYRLTRFKYYVDRWRENQSGFPDPRNLLQSAIAINNQFETTHYETLDGYVNNVDVELRRRGHIHA